MGDQADKPGMSLESDWKLFSSRIRTWQRRHIEKLIAQYKQLLDKDGEPADKFWDLRKRIEEDKDSIGVVADMRRSKMVVSILSLLEEGVIGAKDLEGFSDELKAKLKVWKSLNG